MIEYIKDEIVCPLCGKEMFYMLPWRHEEKIVQCDSCEQGYEVSHIIQYRIKERPYFKKIPFELEYKEEKE